MSPELRLVADLVARETGIVVRDPQLPALAAALSRLGPGMNAGSFLLEADSLASDVALIGRLIDEVTVKETYFFRELRELESIDWQRMREIAEARGSATVRVWVSACATGEEAYTIAILASEAFGTASPPISILATDVSGAALARAQEARYSERSLRQLPPALLERYFTRDGAHHVARHTLKSLVRFRHHNLVSDPAPPTGEVPFEVVACRNVLIYFDGETVERVIASLETAVRDSGRLILGAADRISGTASRLGRAAAATAGGAGPADRRRTRRKPARDLRRPLGREPGTPRRRVEDRIEDALLAADAGDLPGAIEIIGKALEKDPLNASSYFVRGLAELGQGHARSAEDSFRRALYFDPTFGLAAFQLGRAHDSTGDGKAARRAYEQALRTLDADDERHRLIMDQVDIGDVAGACRRRLQQLSAG
jgi:chemotaxis protein methyltransferase CheR